jgi:pSer/pThr/pTyr-binding forkhead associated (FHA) protein
VTTSPALDVIFVAAQTQRPSRSQLDQQPEDQRTSACRADFINKQDGAATAGVAQGALFGVEGLQDGSAFLEVKRGPSAGARFLLDQVTTTAGRHPKSEILLDDITVSRRHDEFRCVRGEFQVADVGSLNGTYVNGEPITSAALENGDELQIGKFRLVFLTGDTTGVAQT